MAFSYYWASIRPSSQNFLFDVYPSTTPSFSVHKCLKKDFVGQPAIVIVEDDGVLFTERPYAFQSDGTLPLATILSDLSGNTGLVTKIYCHNAPSIFYQQTIRANMPVIAAGGSIKTDSVGNVTMEFSGTQNMEIPLSTSIFKLLHNGTVCSQLFQIQQNGTVTQAFFATGGFASGFVGWSLFGNNFFANALHITVRIPGTVQRVSTLDNSIVASTSAEVFITTDLTNAVAADRCIVHVNGTEFKLNTIGSTSTPPDVNSTLNMQMGLFGIFECNGYITSGIFFDGDESANRLDILTYL